MRRWPACRRTSSCAKEDNAAVGVYLSSTGNARDTVGVFVQSVVAGGPAEKAGLVEGDRIASINGVDVREPRGDVGDCNVASSRIEGLVLSQRRLARAEQDRGGMTATGTMHFSGLWVEDGAEQRDEHAGRIAGAQRSVCRLERFSGSGMPQGLEAKLDPSRFLRIHRFTLVNVERIKQVEPFFHGDYIVTLQSGKELTLSASYRDRLLEQTRRSS